MLGLFGTLNLGARALQVQQTGVEVAGQNLANANNPAYARQRVNLAASVPLNTPYGQEGTGVQLVSIEQIRDIFLDAQVRDETSVGGFYGAQQSALDSAQTALNEFLDDSASSINGNTDAGGAASAKSLSAQINLLFGAFQNAAADPSSLGNRQAVISRAAQLTKTFNQVSGRLNTVNANLNASISQDVNSANQLLSQIAELNREIAAVEAPGVGPANELRDDREQKLEALAKLVNFQTTTNDDGTISLSVGGTTLIDKQSLTDTLQAYDPGNGQIQIRTATGGNALAPSGGSIAGNIAARDGAMADLRSGLDNLASQLVTQINAVYSTGFDLQGNTGSNFLTGATAGTISVNSALLNDPALLQIAGSAGAVADNTVALALARLATTRQAGLNNQTFSDAYSGTVTRFANAISNADDEVANHESVQSLLLNRRDSVSGVSMEEEMTSLMTFQKAYQAAARIVTTVDQMLEEVVNLKR